MWKLDQILLHASESFLRDLRRRLLLIVLVAVLPVLGVILYQAKISRDLMIAETQENAWKIAENVTIRQARFLESAKQLLTLLSDAPQMAYDDGALCGEFLRQVAERNSVYVDLGLADTFGDVRCRARSVKGGENLARFSHFQRAIAARHFAVGDYRSHASGRNSVGLAMPILATEGAVRAIVFAELDVDWINQLAAESHLPAGVTLSIVDSRGTLLARFPESGKWVGKHIPDASLFEMLRLRRQDNRELTGLDGVARVYALKPLSLNPGAGQFYVMVGIPKSLATSPVSRALAHNLIWLFGVALAAGTCAWLTGSKFVVGYVQARIKAEEERARLAAIVESSEDAIIGMTLDGTVMTWNDGAESTYGFSDAEIVGKPVFQLIPPAHHHELHELLDLVRQGRGINRYESKRIRKDGRFFDVSASLSPIRDVHRNVVGAATITRDISALRKGEEQRLAYTAQLETLNVTALEISETLSVEQVIERGLNRLLSAGGFDLAFMHFPTDAAPGRRVFAASAAPRPAAELEGICSGFGDGFERGLWHSIDPSFIEDVAAAPQAVPAPSHSIRSLAILPLSRDSGLRAAITVMDTQPRVFGPDERQFLQAMARQIALAVENSRLYGATVRANQGLRKEIDERKRAEQTLADFTAMVVHDLRSPLSNIISIIESARDGVFGPITDLQRKWLWKVEDSCKSLIDHISDFLDLSKIDAGKLQLNKTRVDLNAILHDAFAEHTVEAERRRISFRTEISEGLPPLTLDARRINHVLENLLSNAFKFTENGGEIVIAARRWKDARVVWWVKDSGIGIPREEFDHIFDKYRQVTGGEHSSTGTGLGLAICKKVVEAHGGRIWVESELDKGSTFFVSLPVLADDPVARDCATPA